MLAFFRLLEFFRAFHSAVDAREAVAVRTGFCTLAVLVRVGLIFGVQRGVMHEVDATNGLLVDLARHGLSDDDRVFLLRFLVLRISLRVFVVKVCVCCEFCL